MRVVTGLTVCLVLIGYAAGLAAAQDCDACGVREAPRALPSAAIIAPAGEPGEPLLIRGTVFRPDRRTPARDVIVYAFHTNAGGIYPKRGDEQGYGRWHGYLRAWARTDAQGRYEFRTIRPGTYPTRAEPAHVHMEIQTSDGRAYSINDIVDVADPLVDDRYRRRLLHHRGGSGVAPFTRDSAGVWHVRRDIVLEP